MKLAPILFLAVLFFACSKDSKTKRRLVGDWKVDIVRIEDGDGFLFYDSLAVGEFQFNASSLTGSVSYQYAYFNQYWIQDSVAFNESVYFIDTKGEVISIIRSTDTLNAKIIMLTNKSLTFEYYDQLAFRLKRYTCTRK